MGIKELWTVLTPYCERKPFYELRGKTVAIDLAGWVCESLNVVDYFVHPRQHLKNLFFRTCYLIWEDVTPVFVLEGTAPKLKAQVIAKRNEIQFRGVKPKESPPTQPGEVKPKEKAINTEKGRSRFNHVLKQCENLLRSMGITCVQGPGEAEAYCAFLNKKGLVDGVISQDSDCFAYGAVRVYRNFSVSTQGTSSAQGGAVDLYDMDKICQDMDFGQNKIIVMGLLCGCDYCPDGVGGVGRDGVVKLFNRYKNDIIIDRIKSWRRDDDRYSQLELRVDDKNICSNCGHLGRTQSHTKSGCGSCGTHRGCDSSLWKEQRLSLKAELALRKKALQDPTFPSQDIINEFLNEPATVPDLDLRWKQPNLIKFIKQVGHLLQWQEVYCFQKFFPILTRWQIRFLKVQPPGAVPLVIPEEIVKKRTVKGVASLEVRWKDHKNMFHGLIPDEQLEIFAADNPKGFQDLWTSVEPENLMEEAYPDMVREFLASKEKPKKVKKTKKATATAKENAKQERGSLNDLSALIETANEVAKTIKPKKAPAKPKPKKGLQMIEKFLLPKKKPLAPSNAAPQCSTPKNKCIPSDLESDCDDEFDMSDIISGIIKNSAPPIQKHGGKLLLYDAVKWERSFGELDGQKPDGKLRLSNSVKWEHSFGHLEELKSASSLQKVDRKLRLSDAVKWERSCDDLDGQKPHGKLRLSNSDKCEQSFGHLEGLQSASPGQKLRLSGAVKWERSIDDLDFEMEARKRSHSISILQNSPKKFSLDDSIDALVAGKENLRHVLSPVTHIDRFFERNNSLGRSTPKRRSLIKEEPCAKTSYFFEPDNVGGGVDEFEKSMDISFLKTGGGDGGADVTMISDSSVEE